MRLLVIKTSSLGDVIHTLPAVTDACNHIEGLSVDWVVEESFREVPAWHRAVGRVIPVALRRWRRRPWSIPGDDVWRSFRRQLRERRYDLVIDAQGLFKTSWIGRIAKGRVAGLDRRSAREGLCTWLYDVRYRIPFGSHAIDRNRRLFAEALGYANDELGDRLDFGIDIGASTMTPARPYAVFVHGTAWPTKLWPESSWRRLAEKLISQGRDVIVPSGSADEHARARRITAKLQGASAPEPGDLTSMAQILAGAERAFCVDTGLAHLAAAVGTATTTLFGPSDPSLTTPRGVAECAVVRSTKDCAPCVSASCRIAPHTDGPPPCMAELTI